VAGWLAAVEACQCSAHLASLLLLLLLLGGGGAVQCIMIPDDVHSCTWRV